MGLLMSIGLLVKTEQNEQKEYAGKNISHIQNVK